MPANPASPRPPSDGWRYVEEIGPSPVYPAELYCVVVDAADDFVCRVEQPEHGPLLAAAPALRDALEAVTDRLALYEHDYGPGYDPPVIPLARAALARAQPAKEAHGR